MAGKGQSKEPTEWEERTDSQKVLWLPHAQPHPHIISTPPSLSLTHTHLYKLKYLFSFFLSENKNTTPRMSWMLKDSSCAKNSVKTAVCAHIFKCSHVHHYHCNRSWVNVRKQKQTKIAWKQLSRQKLGAKYISDFVQPPLSAFPFLHLPQLFYFSSLLQSTKELSRWEGKGNEHKTKQQLMA